MRVTFGQLVRIGPLRTWWTAAQNYRVDPHNILLGAGTSPRMGSLHVCNIWTIGSHWPIKSMPSVTRDNRVGPYDILLAGGTRPCVGPLRAVTFGQLARIIPRCE